MTNAEKYQEVFGYELEEDTTCTTKKFDKEDCKYCLERNRGVCGCKQWMNAEYEEKQ